MSLFQLYLEVLDAKTGFKPGNWKEHCQACYLNDNGTIEFNASTGLFYPVKDARFCY